jgi:hypothetical protein
MKWIELETTDLNLEATDHVWHETIEACEFSVYQKIWMRVRVEENYSVFLDVERAILRVVNEFSK